MKTVLLTGGAGYIGSHTGYLLHTLGYRVIILDNLGHKQKFLHQWAELIIGDMGDQTLLHSIFSKYKIHAVMHFAAFIEVGESVIKPALFYHNNIVNTLKLLDTMREYDVKKIIFSSTCALYGQPVYTPMDEKHPYSPLSPYGKTKLAIEYALHDYAHAYDFRYVALRYFNAAGALWEHNLGECHEPETHVIPLLLRAAQQKQVFKILGDDYQTHDGTCVRDYVHVADIARAHLLALNYLDAGNKSDIFNLGTGDGYSVRQLVSMAEKACNKRINVVILPRRSGDAPVLVADNTKAKRALGWQPQDSGLENIISSAWKWELMKKSIKTVFIFIILLSGFLPVFSMNVEKKGDLTDEQSNYDSLIKIYQQHSCTLHNNFLKDGDQDECFKQLVISEQTRFDLFLLMLEKKVSREDFCKIQEELSDCVTKKESIKIKNKIGDETFYERKSEFITINRVAMLEIASLSDDEKGQMKKAINAMTTLGNAIGKAYQDVCEKDIDVLEAQKIIHWAITSIINAHNDLKNNNQKFSQACKEIVDLCEKKFKTVQKSKSDSMTINTIFRKIMKKYKTKFNKLVRQRCGLLKLQLKD